MMKPVVSIIIPCYKSEATVEETLKSVLEQKFESWEALIINDGSPDNIESIALKWTDKDERFKYYKKENGGLGSARNYGIERALGEYILPLDSDNKIRPLFVKSAVHIFEGKTEIGVVYGDAMKFGAVNELWEIGEFDILKMLHHNYIDACCLLRKSIFDKLGLYDENIPYQGHEDWELWLRIIKSKFQFYYHKKISFDYRVTNDSMIRSFNREMLFDNELYIKKKHSELYQKFYSKLYYKYLALHIQTSNSVLFKLERKFRKL